MGKHDKVHQRVFSGMAVAGIKFEALCAMLTDRGFSMRCNRGSHHVFSRQDIEEIINLQPDRNGDAKPYQVRQVRDILQKYSIR